MNLSVLLRIRWLQHWKKYEDPWSVGRDSVPKLFDTKIHRTHLATNTQADSTGTQQELQEKPEFVCMIRPSKFVPESRLTHPWQSGLCFLPADRYCFFFLLGVWMMHTWIVSWWDKSKIPGTNWVQFYEKFSDFDVSCCDVAWMSLLVAICRPRLRWTDCGTVGLQSLVSFWIGCPGPLSFRRCNTWEKEVY